MVKIVRSADGQSVALPDGYRFDTDDVRISREGDRVILEPGDRIDVETGLPLSRLRALIQEGLESGPSEPLDMDAIRREARAAWEARR
ncbi:hypothetical protein [Sphingomonas sp.]|jgi:virulence-associated protein VagC|uniref:hypothetical protein n=1 Tax=Sphingomonas sp. TaxID=28214 RepID=UPI002D7F2E96|nr:hypothetical protein [Sphingomonas sp.]HEU0045926.1 hypothetical protein [Sphingomonas sp.]